MTCTCGLESAEEASFCSSCGKDFRATAPESLELDESTSINRSPSRASLKEVKLEAKARKQNQKKSQKPNYKANRRKWELTMEVKVASTLVFLALSCFLVYTLSSAARPSIGSFVSQGSDGLKIMGSDIIGLWPWILDKANFLIAFVKESI